MRVYTVPHDKSTWPLFRIFGWGTVGLLCILCIVSYWSGITDSLGKMLACIAALSVLGVVGFSFFLSSRSGWRTFIERFEFELSDTKITQKRVGYPIVEIPLDQIESINDFRNWLVIKRGGEHHQEITIPSAVSGFDELKQELSNHRAIAPPKTAPHIYAALFQLLLTIVACCFVFVSHNRSIILIAGSPILLIEGLSLYSIWRRRKKILKWKLSLAVYASMWLLTALIIYERFQGSSMQ
jgi:hypothetical protein